MKPENHIAKNGVIEPGQFCIAVCSLGVYGVILSETPQEKVYADGNKGVAWKGIVIRDTVIKGIGGHAGKTIHVKTGSDWSSKHPKVVYQMRMADHLSQEELIRLAKNKISTLLL